jgi:hypothetical protein
MQYHQLRILCALRDKIAENDTSPTGHQAMDRARARDPEPKRVIRAVSMIRAHGCRWPGVCAATVVGSRCRGLLVGACEWQSLEVRACLPETPS